MVPVTLRIVNREDGSPVPACAAGMDTRERCIYVTSVEEGGIALPEVPDARPGKWAVEADVSGFFPERFEIRVPPTGPAGPFEIPLRPGPGTTQGLVLDDETGKPIEGVRVSVAEMGYHRCTTNRRESVTGRSGRFHIDGRSA